VSRVSEVSPFLIAQDSLQSDKPARVPSKAAILSPAMIRSSTRGRRPACGRRSRESSRFGRRGRKGSGPSVVCRIHSLPHPLDSCSTVCEPKGLLTAETDSFYAVSIS
jgi:hypothetical protein